MALSFFLFAPALTTFNSSRDIKGLTHVIYGEPIFYDNGARVNTSFIHNLTPHIKVKSAPSLLYALQNLQKSKPKLPKYEYPANVAMVNDLQKLVKAGIDFEITDDECVFIRRLDSQISTKKQLFGGGSLLSDVKASQLQDKVLQAKALQAKECQTVWQLSEGERLIVEGLNKSKANIGQILEKENE